METQSDTLKEVLSELFALLEAQETNSAALLQLLKDQGIASDEKLSTYLEQAGRGSNVKWRAARMRMEYLLTPIQKETADKDNSKQAEPKEAEPKEAEPKEAEPKEAEPKEAEPKEAEPKEAEPKKRNPKKRNPKKRNPKKRNPKKRNLRKSLTSGRRQT